jgi:hypothetical protein
MVNFSIFRFVYCLFPLSSNAFKGVVSSLILTLLSKKSKNIYFYYTTLWSGHVFNKFGSPLLNRSVNTSPINNFYFKNLSPLWNRT